MTLSDTAAQADRWLTRAETAERLGVSTKTLAHWGPQGKGPQFSKFGRLPRYRLSDVIAWEKGQPVWGGEPA